MPCSIPKSTRNLFPQASIYVQLPVTSWVAPRNTSFIKTVRLDSYILTNYYSVPEDRSYSFSLEPIFILKNHLISNYEGFFLTENHDNNIIAWTETEFRITVVNEANLFERSKETICFIKDEKVLKNHAFGISMINRHEMNSHQKKI